MSSQKAESTLTFEPHYFFLYDQAFLDFEPPAPFWLFCIAPSLLYLLCVFVIFPWMAPKSKSAVLLVSRLRTMHNAFLCVYSGFACFTAAYEMIKAGEFGFWTLSLRDMLPMLCNEPSEYLKIVNYTFIASKIYEMLDTAFIVWLKNDHARAILAEAKPKKQIEAASSSATSSRSTATASTRITVSGAEGSSSNNKKKSEASELNFLHLYHHCTTFWLFLLVADLPGTLKLGPLLNGFVHFLMYGHYVRPIPFAYIITICQIAQLSFVTWSWYLVATHCPGYKEFTEKHFLEYLTPYFMVPVYLVFFIKFFFERFLSGLIFGKKKNNNANKIE
jgi:hypothetical protein